MGHIAAARIYHNLIGLTRNRREGEASLAERTDVVRDLGQIRESVAGIDGQHRLENIGVALRRKSKSAIGRGGPRVPDCAKTGGVERGGKRLVGLVRCSHGAGYKSVA